MSEKVFDRLRGKFIVFDGVDGAGKGAQLKRLEANLETHGIEVVRTRDPGGTVIGDRIRHVILDYDLAEMDVRCETFLFMASRAQLARDVIGPAVSEGKACLGDRYVSATCAYQGAAGYDPKRVVELAQFAIGDTWPSLTIIIDMPPKEAFKRTGRKTNAQRKNAGAEGQTMLFHDAHTDAMEARPLEFHQRVREIFLELPNFYPAPVVIVDGNGSEDDVETRVTEALANAAL
ncbi:MAG: dTMP kinase [Phycisphaerales bacterium]|nr:dTMP kinase [Phycisphaerales bacterium]